MTETGGQMGETGTMQLQAQTERWVNLTGSDGKTKARLNIVTGELVMRDRGVYHKWALRFLLTNDWPQQSGEGLQSP